METVEEFNPSPSDGRVYLELHSLPNRCSVLEPLRVGVRSLACGDAALRLMLNVRLKGQSKSESVAFESEAEDLWFAEWTPRFVGTYQIQVIAWVDQWQTDKHVLQQRKLAGADVYAEMLEMAERLRAIISSANAEEAEYLEETIRLFQHPNLGEFAFSRLESEAFWQVVRRLLPEPKSAERTSIVEVEIEDSKKYFLSWYEFFPHSWLPSEGGSIGDTLPILKHISQMGFSVVLLPPIHPVSSQKIPKVEQMKSADIADPWIIGSDAGGHLAFDPRLGQLSDFSQFTRCARSLDLRVGMHVSFRCSTDHPWISEHPEWFNFRSDGTLQQDFARRSSVDAETSIIDSTVPFDFSSPSARTLWQALRDVILTWVSRGVDCFCIDRPGDLSFGFLKWLIAEVSKRYPHVVFQAASYSRPSVRSVLAQQGFHQLYGYYPWKNSKAELEDYLSQVAELRRREGVHEIFVLNAPDLLPQSLREGGRPTFIARLVIAAAAGGCYSMYSGYEFCEREAVPNSEAYATSERTSKVVRDLNQPGNLIGLIRKVNLLRNSLPALRYTHTYFTIQCQNEMLFAFGRRDPEGDSHLIVVVSLDAWSPQEGVLELPGFLAEALPLQVYDVLSGATYRWHHREAYVKLEPDLPAHLFVCSDE